MNFQKITPQLEQNHGTGANPNARNPSRLFPQPSPRVLYTWGPARGKKVPKNERRTVLAARAEAA